MAATWGAQIPAASITSSVEIGPWSVRTPVDVPICRELEARHPHAGPDPDAELAGRIGQGVGRAVRVEMAVAGQVDRAVERVRRDGGHQAARLVGRDHADVEADPPRPAGGPLELEELVVARREAQAADALEDAELLVQLDAVAPELHHRRRRIEGGHDAGGVAGRAGRQLRLLDEEDIGPAGQRQVVGDAAAGDPAADDDDASVIHRGRALVHRARPLVSHRRRHAAPARTPAWRRWRAAGRNAPRHSRRSRRRAC